jgi:serine/threonine protein kinase
MDRDDIARQRSRRPISIDYPDGKTFTFNTKNSGNVTIQLPKGINGPINFLGEGMEAYVLRAKQRDKDVKVKIFKKLPGEKTQETYSISGPIPDGQINFHAILWARAQQFPDLSQYLNQFISSNICLVNDDIMPCAVLGYIDGSTIEKKKDVLCYELDENARDDFRIIIPQLIKGMKAISLAGFYHTDFYLGNVIYNPTTKTAFLDDLSMVVDKPFISTDYVEDIPDHEVIGPPPTFAYAVSDRYRAPEVARIRNDRFPIGVYDCNRFTEHSTQYALTVALYILLTDDAIFRLELSDGQSGYNNGLEKVLSTFKGAQKDFLLKGLTFNPENRFESYSDMLMQFENSF